MIEQDVQIGFVYLSDGLMGQLLYVVGQYIEQYTGLLETAFDICLEIASANSKGGQTLQINK